MTCKFTRHLGGNASRPVNTPFKVGELRLGRERGWRVGVVGQMMLMTKNFVNRLVTIARAQGANQVFVGGFSKESHRTIGKRDLRPAWVKTENFAAIVDIYATVVVRDRVTAIGPQSVRLRQPIDDLTYENGVTRAVDDFR